MTLEKFFLPIILTFTLSLTGFNQTDYNLKNKYNKTSYNFPYINYICCNDSTNYSDIRSAIDIVIQLTGGNVTKAELKFKKDIPVWIAEATGKNNNSFIVELSSVNYSLLRIEAETGPFDYELDPGKGFIKFSESRKIAEEHSGQKTLKWRFFKNRNIWEYDFWLFLKSGKAQLRINAETGEIISGKKKK